MSTLGVTCGVTDLFGGDLSEAQLPYRLSVLGWQFGVNGAEVRNPRLGVSGAGL